MDERQEDMGRLLIKLFLATANSDQSIYGKQAGTVFLTKGLEALR